MAHSCWVIEENLIKDLFTTLWARFQDTAGKVQYPAEGTVHLLPPLCLTQAVCSQRESCLERPGRSCILHRDAATYFLVIPQKEWTPWLHSLFFLWFLLGFFIGWSQLEDKGPRESLPYSLKISFPGHSILEKGGFWIWEGREETCSTLLFHIICYYTRASGAIFVMHLYPPV